MGVCPTCAAIYPGFAFCPDDGARLTGVTAAAESPLVGRVLDRRYRVVRKVGQGGSAEVFKADHIHLNRPVALKIMHEKLLSDYEAIERFQREATIATNIGHPNIVRIEDFCVLDDGTFCLAMEWLDGESLDAHLERGPIAVSDAVIIAAQICSGLDAAHEVDIIHRDLKPQNILLLEGQGEGPPRVKILDFGIAKMVTDNSPVTRAGMVMGTPHYVSPEQARAEALDRRSDIYSLGVMLYEMVTGEVPFDAPTALQVLQMHAERAPESPRAKAPDRPIGEDLERVILRCLEKRPARRYQRAQELASALLDLDPAATSTLPSGVPRLRRATPAAPVSAIDELKTIKVEKVRRKDIAAPAAALSPELAELAALGRTHRLSRLRRSSKVKPPSSRELAVTPTPVDNGSRTSRLVVAIVAAVVIAAFVAAALIATG